VEKRLFLKLVSRLFAYFYMRNDIYIRCQRQCAMWLVLKHLT